MKAALALLVLALVAPAYSSTRDLLQSRSSAPAPAASGITDIDILNFALNLEYLEASFYYWAAYGRDIDSSLLGSNPGQLSGGQSANLSGSPDISGYAKQIADNELAHVKFLRTAISSAGGTPVDRPALNIGTAFADAANAAFNGTTLSPAFNPYLNPLFFLHGAFIFEDAGVTAYKGAVRLIASPDILEAAAGILAVEAYHGGIIRTALCPQRDATTPYGVTPAVITQNIAQLENTLAGGSNNVIQGITTTLNGQTICNLVPADSNAIAVSRTPAQIIAIVTAGQGKGLFFPNGLNGKVA